MERASIATLKSLPARQFRWPLKTGAIEKADFVFMFSSVGYDQKTIVKYVYDFCGGAPL